MRFLSGLFKFFTRNERSGQKTDASSSKSHHSTSSALTRRFRGWRASLKLLCIASWFMLFVNITISVALSVMFTDQNKKRYTATVVMMNSSCDKVGSADMWIHLVMNVCSAVLLGGTNFAMQAWAAPTRADIDRVHEVGETLDIGIPSIRNMLFIRPVRLIMWSATLLAVLPLHLVYNSAIYRTSSMSDCDALMVSEDLVKGPFEVPPEADYQAQNITHPVHFDLKGPDWRQVPLGSLREDFDKNKDTYGAVVFVADAQSTRGSRYNESEPVSGVLYHRLKPSILDTGRDDPQWMSDIVLVLTRDMNVSIKNDYEWLEVNPNIDMDVDIAYPGLAYNRTIEPWWVTLCRNPWNSQHQYEHNDCQGGHTPEPDRGFDPLTPVYRLQSNIWVKKIVPECRLFAEPLFWWLTTLCNLVIAGCLSSMAWFYTSTPLVTIGDVIDSFLTHPPPPDSRTIPRSSCTYSSPAFRNMFRPSLAANAYQSKSRRWWKVVFIKRWSLTMLWFTYLLAQCIVFYTLMEGDKGPTSIFDSKATTAAAAGADQTIDLFQVDGSDVSPKRWRLVLLINAPQIFLSLTYLFFNNILTTMVAEQEWHSFFASGAAKKKKVKFPRSLLLILRFLRITSRTIRTSSRTLRTSQPRGSQRSTFFLSLPYRYAIPFVATSSAMHWLLSQCLFFSEVDFFDIDRKLNQANPTTSTLRYSSWALVWVIILACLSWGAILGLAVCRRYPAGMPMMGCCSAVIAAACHAPLRAGARRGREGGDGDEEEGDMDTDIAAGPLSWGVIRQVVVRDGVEVEEKWLGFTRGEAETPVVGEVYG